MPKRYDDLTGKELDYGWVLKTREKSTQPTRRFATITNMLEYCFTKSPLRFFLMGELAARGIKVFTPELDHVIDYSFVVNTLNEELLDSLGDPGPEPKPEYDFVEIDPRCCE